MAGGVYNTANSNYYLYNGEYFWTLSPARFLSNYSIANVWRVTDSGSTYHWGYVTEPVKVRPVINLKTDTQIIKGDGTSIAPYVIK